MNTHTGATYELGDDFAERVVPSFHFQNAADYRDLAEEKAAHLEEMLPLREGRVADELGRELSDDERRAVHDLRHGQSIVTVAAEVAHAQQLGQRELDRRRRRRRAARGARRKNR